MDPRGGRKQQARVVAAAAAEMNPSLPPEDAERLARAVRGLASDLEAERRRSKALEREVKQLKAELAKARRGGS